MTGPAPMSPALVANRSTFDPLLQDDYRGGGAKKAKKRTKKGKRSRGKPATSRIGRAMGL